MAISAPTTQPPTSGTFASVALCGRKLRRSTVAEAAAVAGWVDRAVKAGGGDFIGFIGTARRWEIW